jgi:hypothetical protein
MGDSSVIACNPETKARLGRTSALIGCMERTLIYLFVLADWPDGIGYLLAAKSVLRFSDIRKQREWSYAEYVIAGTFASVAWAFLVVQLVRLALRLG